MSRRYSIGEVGRLLQVKPYVIRYWEEEIPFIAPKKSKSGRRIYSGREVQMLLRVKHLLYEKRYTIEGARETLWREAQPGQADLKARIAAVRGELLAAWDKVRGKRER